MMLNNPHTLRFLQENLGLFASLAWWGYSSLGEKGVVYVNSSTVTNNHAHPMYYYLLRRTIAPYASKLLDENGLDVTKAVERYNPELAFVLVFPMAETSLALLTVQPLNLAPPVAYAQFREKIDYQGMIISDVGQAASILRHL